MENHWVAKLLVTRRLKKDERFFPKDKSPQDAALEIAERAAREREEEEMKREMAKLKKEESRARAQAKAKEAKTAAVTSEEVSEDDLDLSV